MSCCSGRPKAADIRADQKWDFISLNDFKSTSCFGGFAYVYLWGSLIVSVAVYGVDTFTAVNLLAFDRWSGTIAPAIPLNISKWIFSACIIASWVNLGWEYVRAVRVIKRGAVAESYLDSLAVRLQCIRMGQKGRGWRRFLVFAELTKSKKGTEYIALFTYFAFQAWIRIIFCQGPRQVVNALTLYAVFNTNLNPAGAGNAGSAFIQFFKNIGILADQQHQQAVILSGMLFTLIIWVFGALSLILAMMFYILFLWHYIPNADGGLSGYCERKINQRLAAIVSVKVNKAIDEEERKRQKSDAKAIKNGEKPVFNRTATLPTFFDSKDGDHLPNMPVLNRNETMTTLPAYSSRPGTPSGQPLPAFELAQLEKRPIPSRSTTNATFASSSPLMFNASEMGYGRSDSPAPNLPPLSANGFAAPQRAMTGSSQNSQWNHGPPPGGPGGVPPRMLPEMGDRGYSASPVSYTDNRPPPSSHINNGFKGGFENYGHPTPISRATNDFSTRSNTPVGPAPSMGRRTPFDPNYPPQAPPSEYGRNSPAPPYGPGSEYGRNSPAPSQIRGPAPFAGSGSEYGRSSPAPSARGPTSPIGNGYQAYNPNARSASSATPKPYQTSSTPGLGPQYRNMTDPGTNARGTQQGDYFSSAPTPYFSGAPTPMPQRPGTAQSSGGYSTRQNIARSAGPAPYNGGSDGFGPMPGQGQQAPFRR